MSQTQVLWASNTPKEGIFVDKKTRRIPLKGDCLDQQNANSLLPQPRTPYSPSYPGGGCSPLFPETLVLFALKSFRGGHRNTRSLHTWLGFNALKHSFTQLLCYMVQERRCLRSFD